VRSHADAYADVDWDSPDMAIDPGDERFRPWVVDPLACTDWYHRQSPDLQARVGLHRVAVAMRTGWEFENVLQRGLLEFVYWLPNHRPEFRYAHHEIIEESQHTLMFQEFANRTGLDVAGMARHMKLMARFVVPLSRRFPSLFFLFVVGGEDPVDHVQRHQLRAGVPHPLLERIMRIHVAEEARHLSFARHYLRRTVPALDPVRRATLVVAAPVLFRVLGSVMVLPSARLARQYGIPRRDLRRARRSPAGRQLLRDALAQPRRMCLELGLVPGPGRVLWRALGIWDDPGDDARTPPPRRGAPRPGAAGGLDGRGGGGEPRRVLPGAQAAPPRVPASAGALVFDGAGRLLVLKPTYKRGWTVPGGQMEDDGETPWEACRREVHEECGLDVAHGHLVCVDFLRPRPDHPGGLRFLFDCGTVDDTQLAAVVLQPEEIAEHRLVPVEEALTMLSGPLRRRVGAAVGASTCVYLEDGRPPPSPRSRPEHDDPGPHAREAGPGGARPRRPGPSQAGTEGAGAEGAGP
jgi:8-oxo-dGTP pyrophosphatase MutT (NUDIX family)